MTLKISGYRHQGNARHLAGMDMIIRLTAPILVLNFHLIPASVNKYIEGPHPRMLLIG